MVFYKKLCHGITPLAFSQVFETSRRSSGDQKEMQSTGNETRSVTAEIVIEKKIIKFQGPSGCSQVHSCPLDQVNCSGLLRDVMDAADTAATISLPVPWESLLLWIQKIHAFSGLPDQVRAAHAGERAEHTLSGQGEATSNPLRPSEDMNHFINVLLVRGSGLWRRETYRKHCLSSGKRSNATGCTQCHAF